MGTYDNYWKIAAESDGRLWNDWKSGGYVSIGWSELGDIGKITKEEFNEKSQALEQKYGENYSITKLTQVWRFKSIPLGSYVVANQGTKKIFGIGKVVGGYFFKENEEYSHRLSVEWEDVRERRVKMDNWRGTIIKINPEAVKIILSDATLVGASSSWVEPSLSPAVGVSPCRPRNVILYGPPGTGKTYATMRRALELIENENYVADEDDSDITDRFRRYQNLGRIQFVTFHQSYGYEEFVEGIRPVLGPSSDSQVQYKIHDGVFKKIALRAASEGFKKNKEQNFDDLWVKLIREIKEEGPKFFKSSLGKFYQISIKNNTSVVAQLCTVDENEVVTQVHDTPYYTVTKNSLSIYWKNKDSIGPEPEKITGEIAKNIMSKENSNHGSHNYTAFLGVYSILWDYYKNLKKEDDLFDGQEKTQRIFDTKEGKDQFLFNENTNQYVLIIDEINRGNISKIFGELITLLEPDKRLTAPHEIRLPLTYTPEHLFAVPPNLHIIGTMNTADRSIALMDVALRRRFTFEEVMPDAGVLWQCLDRVGCPEEMKNLVVDIFKEINRRIKFLFDREHQLGHAYFMKAVNASSLREVLLEHVVPMLQEYFYGAWDKICIVLGCPYNDRGKPNRNAKNQENYLLDDSKEKYKHAVIVAEPLEHFAIPGVSKDELQDHLDYRINPDLLDPALEEEKLWRTFLGILVLDGSSFEARLQKLLTLDSAEGDP